MYRQLAMPTASLFTSAVSFPLSGDRAMPFADKKLSHDIIPPTRELDTGAEDALFKRLTLPRARDYEVFTRNVLYVSNT